MMQLDYMFQKNAIFKICNYQLYICNLCGNYEYIYYFSNKVEPLTVSRYDLIIKHKDEIAQLITLEQGKPLKEALGEVQI